MTKRIFHLITVVFIVSALAGCGQKGPLFIPEEPETTGSEQQRDEGSHRQQFRQPDQADEEESAESDNGQS